MKHSERNSFSGEGVYGFRVEAPSKTNCEMRKSLTGIGVDTVNGVTTYPGYTVDPRFNFALSQVFSPSFLKKIDNTEHEAKIKHLLINSGLCSQDEDWNLLKGLELTYEYLRNSYRCEYVYMNEIANQLLLRYHSDNSATLLKEVNSDGSIADIVIINGKTVAYEIKTELDSFERLEDQVQSYKNLYDQIYVVTHANAVKRLKQTLDKRVGILLLQHNGNLQTIRESKSLYKSFTPSKAVFTLRQSELVMAYEKYVGKLPVMGTALIHQFCIDWYINLKKVEAHIIFAEALKSRKPSEHQFRLIKKCAPSLKAMFLGRTLTKKSCNTAMDRLSIFD